MSKASFVLSLRSASIDARDMVALKNDEYDDEEVENTNKKEKKEKLKIIIVILFGLGIT